MSRNKDRGHSKTGRQRFDARSSKPTEGAHYKDASRRMDCDLCVVFLHLCAISRDAVSGFGKGGSVTKGNGNSGGRVMEDISGPHEYASEGHS